MKRPWLLPFQPLYAASVAWRSHSFDRYPERAKRLRDPVISVGSLSAGGAGKTPFVIALGDAIRRAGYNIDVLSRGYGRCTQESLRVRPDGSADEFGDEPLLIARRLACPVYVASERFQAGKMAETDRRATRNDRSFSLHLLDDGFQHRQLARAVDIVLLTSEEVRDMLLPAGNLREPLRALRRADVVVLRSDQAEALRPVTDRVVAGTRSPKIWIVDRRAAIVEGTSPPRPLAFCGIARPDSFLTSLLDLKLQVASFTALSDHQHYDEKLIARLMTRAKAEHADGFITTAKDSVKLTPAMRSRLQTAGPIAVCDLQVRLRDEQQCITELLTMVQAWWQRSATMKPVDTKG